MQIWLALLSHLNFDSSAKSRIIMQRVANAQALTLDEEVIQNAARTLLYGVTESATQQTASVSNTASVPGDTWKPTETNESPTLSQRLGRQ